MSRNSVLSAIDLLQADGWVTSRHGSGVFVTEVAPVERAVRAPQLDARARAQRPGTTALRPFELGAPGLDLFPTDVWRRLQTRRWAGPSHDLLGEEPGAGAPELRGAIAEHLAAARGLVCDPAQIFITTGARASLDLAVRGLGMAGARAVAEDPGYHGSRETLRANSMALISGRIDSDGLDIDATAGAGNAQLALVTPACQFPTCAVLSDGRRASLMRWAVASADRWVIEDDYDAEFRWAGRSPAPLAAHGPGQDQRRVLYLNAFNKSLFPALRIGFLVAPADAVDRIARVRQATDTLPGLHMQRTLADFIDQGYLDRHLTRCREAYLERRASLVDAIGAYLAGHLAIDPPLVGSHLPAVTQRLEADIVAEAAAGAGLSVTSFARFRMPAEINDAEGNPAAEHRVALGFAAFQPARITSAARTLAKALDGTPAKSL